MLRVHYLEHSRAHRILWLLEELGAPYEVVRYARRADLRAPEELRDIHPLGKSPVIEDGARVLAESGAMIEELLDLHPSPLRPAPGTEAHLRYRYWLHYAEGSAMPLLVMKLIFSALPRRLPVLVRPVGRMISTGVARGLIDPQLRTHLAFWEAEVARDGWFAGPDFSAADIMMSFPVETGMDRIHSRTETPALRDWLTRIRARPAYARALQTGGAYRYAG